MGKNKTAKDTAAKQPKKAKKAAAKAPEKKAKEEKSLDEFLENWGDDDENAESGDESNKDSGSESEDDEAANKAYMVGLKDNDPELYSYLKENDDELLNFDDSDSEDENGERSGAHEVPDSLEVASDDSEYEDDEEEEDSDGEEKVEAKTKKTKVTLKLLRDWEGKLGQDVTVAILNDVADAFKAAIDGLGSEVLEKANKKAKAEKAKEKAAASRFIVSGGQMFNAVVRLCLTKYEPALRRVLRLEKDASRPAAIKKSKRWSACNRSLKSYTMDLVRLISVLSERSVVTVLLKHVHQLIPFFAALPKSAKHLMKALIDSWSTHEDEGVRILAFLSIMRLTRLDQAAMFESTVKQMYLAYVKNAKFTSPGTWPVINFMRRSLAELFALDQKTAYTHAFVYIRQLGITLRNAITLQKKESIQSVYNWQFVHSVHLWVQLLCTAHPSAHLEPLIYPVTQILTGCVSLVYTPKYYPVRFHLCQMLTQLSSKTGKFIPILPYYLEILQTHNFNKKTNKVSMKPVDFGCILRLSKSQMLENGTKDASMDGVYRGILDYMSTQSHKIAFPELAVPCVMQLKAFLKKNKVANYSKKIKQLVDKIEENSRHVSQKRKSATFGVADSEQIARWENEVQEAVPPLLKFHNSWTKVKEEETRKVIARTDEISGDYDFVPKMNAKKKASKKEKEEEFKGIFGGDSDDEEDEDEDDVERFKLKEERGKKRSAPSEEGPKGKRSKGEEASSDEDDDYEDDEDNDESESGDGSDDEEAADDSEEDDSEGDDMDDEVDELKAEDLDSSEEGESSDDE